MKRRRKSETGSLDSLLDTMTNVVGILVILLAVTQLGVGEAVERIAESDSVSPEALDTAAKEVTAAEAAKRELEEQLAALGSDDEREIALEAAALARTIQNARADLTALRQNREQELAAIKEQTAEITEQQETQQKEVSDLQQKITEAESLVAKLRAQLAETPNLSPPPAKVVHLPNPRPAPKEAQPLTFLCRNQRIIFLDLENGLDRAQKRAAFVVTRNRLDANPAAGIDAKRLVNEFNRDPIREDGFLLKLEVRGPYPYVVFERRNDEMGETREQIERGASSYQNRIGRIDPEKYFLRFIVWPDSFEVYLAARGLADRRGLLAGWEPVSISGEYSVRLGGPLRVGPPPKPKPKPPVDPDAPKPPPRPTPPPPSDTID